MLDVVENVSDEVFHIQTYKIFFCFGRENDVSDITIFRFSFYCVRN